MSLSEFKSLFNPEATVKEPTLESKPKTMLLMETQNLMKTRATDLIEEKSTEELIKILQEKKRKLLML